jgi:hypothetical protein
MALADQRENLVFELSLLGSEPSLALAGQRGAEARVPRKASLRRVQRQAMLARESARAAARVHSAVKFRFPTRPAQTPKFVLVVVEARRPRELRPLIVVPAAIARLLCVFHTVRIIASTLIQFCADAPPLALAGCPPRFGPESRSLTRTSPHSLAHLGGFVAAMSAAACPPARRSATA